MKQKFLLFFFLALSFHFLFAEVFQIGSDKPYSSPNTLYNSGLVSDGDTIDIDAQIYSGQQALAVWYGNNLFIRGVGGKPQLIANGAYIQGKGIWVIAGNNCTVENIEFSGASVPDNNGAGIRLDGNGLTLRYCYFHHNENGILTSNPYTGKVTVEYSEFGYNGYGDGYSHNLYIGHIDTLIFRFNYSHHCYIGHTLKTRAKVNIISYNRIMDEETGTASRLIDIPNGGLAFLIGNILMQGPEATNNNLIGYGLEGLSNAPPHDIYIVNNTLINKRVYSAIFIALQTNTTEAVIQNNIFAGPTGAGSLYSGNPTIFTNNIIEPVVQNVGFVNDAVYDYHLTENASAVDFGISPDTVHELSLSPEFEYVHPLNSAHRTISNSIDAGAYEFYGLTSIQTPDKFGYRLIIQNEYITLPNTNLNYLIFQNEGKIILSGKTDGNQISISHLAQGVYFLQIENQVPVRFLKF